jgi:DHA1 family bicyclomycin/chloramphenicol resistance-like MFS transporter
MSLVFMTFMLVPVLAPNIGQGILLIGPWRAIFWVLAGYGATMWLWSFIRLPETLKSEFRRPLSGRAITGAAKIAASDRLSLGYTLAMTAIFGGLTAYIASIQQIVFDTYRVPQLIGLVFGAVAAPMALASWANSRVVGRYGLRRVGHGGLIAFTAITLLHAAVGHLVDEPLWLFCILMGLTMMAFAFTTSNFATLAMTNMAAIAGTASSVQGVAGTIGGALIGLVIGQAFDGTQRPFLIGLATCGIVSLFAVLITERGKLFAGIDVVPQPLMPQPNAAD